jgi:hypothetical protein
MDNIEQMKQSIRISRILRKKLPMAISRLVCH